MAPRVNLVTVIAHPLVQQTLTRLRDRRTGPEEFRRGLGQAAALMVYEATRSFRTHPVKVRTPLADTRGVRLRDEVILVPVLRAGLGMLDPLLRSSRGRASGSSGSSDTRKLWPHLRIIKACQTT